MVAIGLGSLVTDRDWGETRGQRERGRYTGRDIRMILNPYISWIIWLRMR